MDKFVDFLELGYCLLFWNILGFQSCFVLVTEEMQQCVFFFLLRSEATLYYKITKD